MTPHSLARVAGFGLLEALVALALSALVVLAATQGYSSMQYNQSAIDERTQLFATAKLAQNTLRRALQSAGYVDWLSLSYPSKSHAADRWKSIVKKEQAATQVLYGLPALQLMPGSTPIRQILQIVQHSSATDCFGLRPKTQPVVQQFELRSTAQGSQLYCKSFNTKGRPLTQPLVLGVEELSFQFLIHGVWTSLPAGPIPSHASAVLVCLTLVGPKQLARKKHWTTQKRPSCVASGSGGAFIDDIDQAPNDDRLWERMVFIVALTNAYATNKAAGDG